MMKLKIMTFRLVAFDAMGTLFRVTGTAFLIEDFSSTSL